MATAIMIIFTVIIVGALLLEALNILREAGKDRR